MENSNRIICPNCRKELSGDALFCKYCGTALEKQKPTPQETEEAKKGLESLGLELRELCDRMTAAYVDSVKRCELAEQRSAREVQALRERLDELNRALDEEKTRSAELKNQLRRGGEAYARLQEQLKQAQTSSRQSADASTEYCRFCGKPIRPGAAFCANCGRPQN